MGLFSVFKRKPSLNEMKTATSSTADELFKMGKAYALQDVQKAFQYYLQAAKMGHAEAMKTVGYCYLYKGQGAPFDIEQSAYWYKKSAENGNPKSMAMLSWFYMAGRGVPQSDEIAKGWLQKVIDTGDEKLIAIAKRNLDDFEVKKQTITIMFEVTTEMGGSPLKISNFKSLYIEKQGGALEK